MKDGQGLVDCKATVMVDGRRRGAEGGCAYMPHGNNTEEAIG